MNEKFRMTLWKNNKFAWAMYQEMTMNEKLIAQWKQLEKEDKNPYWQGLANGYIKSNQQIKKNILRYGIKGA